MKKILVVDDSRTIHKTVEWLLANQGYMVRVARDGMTALSLLKKFQPDLIVLDVRLENFDGVDLCEIIRCDEDYTTTPIVMLSGLSAEEDISRALKAGANDYLTKPLNDEEFLGAIAKHLS